MNEMAETLQHETISARLLLLAYADCGIMDSGGVIGTGKAVVY